MLIRTLRTLAAALGLTLTPAATTLAATFLAPTFLAPTFLATNAHAQVVNPATAQGPAPGQQPTTTDADAAADTLRSWQLPAIEVTDTKWSPYRDSDLIGSYGQPRWTSRRLFPSTRVYVRREGQLDVEA